MVVAGSDFGSQQQWKIPWHYEGNRKSKHVIHINKDGDAVTSWTAEFFIPYKLLKPLNNVPAQKGSPGVQISIVSITTMVNHPGSGRR